MSWLLPGFLAGAFLAGVPLALHFLRGKPTKTIPFPTLRFLGPSAVRDTRRNRLRRRLTLLLRCLAIALLAAAFARPFWNAAPPGGGKAVLVVVDNSMSMQAPGRWEMLKKGGLDLLDTLRDGDRAGVLLMNPSPQWLVPMSGRVAEAREALAALQPGYETTRCQAALRLAGDTLARQPSREKTLYWMADGQRLGWAGTNFGQPLPPGVRLAPPRVLPAPGSQAAIIDAGISGAAPALRATAAIRLYAPEEQDRTLSVYGDDGKLLGRQVVHLVRDGENSFAVPLDAAAAPRGVRVELDPDDFPADDRFYVSLDAGAALPVLLDAAPGVDFVAHALQAVARRPGGALETRPLPDADWPAGGVAVLRGEAAFLPPQAARLDAFLRRGGSAWVLADGGPAQQAWLKQRGVTAQPLTVSDEPNHLRDWDPGHPLLAGFADDSLLPLLQVGFRRGWTLKAEGADRIASWDDGGAAVLELPGDGGRVLLCGFGLGRDDTDWATRASFVPFADQAVRWLAAAHDGRRAWRIGETVALPDKPGLWKALDAPRPIAPQTATGSIRPTVPGLYEFQENGGAARTFAVNAPADESDLAPWPEPGDLAALQSTQKEASATAAVPATRLGDEAAEGQQRLWWWLMAVALLCLLGELCLANRTSVS